jgi:hypothetical protein
MGFCLIIMIFFQNILIKSILIVNFKKTLCSEQMFILILAITIKKIFRLTLTLDMILCT